MKTINISSISRDWRARKLSNFSKHAINLEGEKITSVEGFIQGIKFPEDHPKRVEAFKSFGYDAKKIGAKAEGKFVWWQGKQIIYRSQGHLELIEKAIEAKFNQHPDALWALLATAGSTLIHYTNRPEMPNTSLPAEKFCEILTKIRKKHDNSKNRIK